MRTVICGLLLSTLLVLAPPRARAQQTLFDFDAPQADQVGSYAPDSGAELTGGVAQLISRANPAWLNPAWPYRLTVTITHPGTAALFNHPVRIDLAAAPVTLFDAARLDGADLLPVRGDFGTEITDKWVEGLDFISRTGVLWIRLPQLDPGDTVIHVYFGNPGWDQPGTPEAFFTDPAGWTSMCVVSPVAAQTDLVVESFVDNNTVQVVGGSGSVLDTRESATIAAALLERGSCLQGTGAFYGTFAGDDVDALVPMGLADTLFISPALRYDDEFDVLSPFGDATVTVYDNATVVATQTVSAATPVTIAANVADNHEIRIESDLPVLVHHRGWDTVGLSDNDAYVMVAPATELLGANSGTSYLVAAQSGTGVDIWYSGGTHESFTLDASTVRTLSAAGSLGSGDAVHILASAPVMAISQADGDGGESVTFLPMRELGRRFVIPRAAEYVLVACAEPATACRILDTAGVEVSSLLSNNYAPHYPNRLRFGAVSAGHELSCDKPVWAMFEDNATNTERNLWPIKLHRPRVADEPTIALGTLEPRYLLDRGTVITPTFVAPFAAASWTAFLEAADVPAGSWLRYQLSDDDGQTWYWFDGDDWLVAASDDQTSPGWQVHYAMDLFPAAAGRLTVKAILGSDDGSRSPALDELRVMYVQSGSAQRFVFDPIASPQVAGHPFEITITATDDLGSRIGSYDGSASLQTLGGLTAPAQTPPFVNGQVTFDVAVGEIGPAVQLYAYQTAVSGSSTPFEVIGAEGARIELVSGDQQFAMAGFGLEDPLLVRVTDSDGNPAGGVGVTFVVTEGEGALSAQPTADATDSELVVTTDESGEAAVYWILGLPPGRQRVQARLEGAQGSPVTFVARADPNPDAPYYTLRGEGGGCGCRTDRGRSGVPFVTAFAMLLLWIRRRRR
jgi:MYXO-CTERM domain-containing protein